VGTAFFPLDEALGLLPGQCTPRLYEGLVLLSAWMPFGRAVSTLATLLGVQLSKASAVRATERAGAAYVARQTAEVVRLEQETPPAPAGGARMVVSADGAMVPLRGGEWGEVRTLAIGVVPAPAENPSDAARRRTEEITYFSRFTTAETFTQQALVETHRRGLEHAGQVAAVMDGADWLQGLADHHCPRALRILDFAHAAQHIAAIGQALWPASNSQANDSQANDSQANDSQANDTQPNDTQAAAWITQWTHRLKHEGPQPLLAELRQLQAQYPDCKPLCNNYAYLAKREAQLHYPEFIQQGWPIGSGMVESANKSVVEARLKGAGMHWQRTHVDPMLALRNLVCNDRWSQEWPHIHAHLLAQAKAQRMQPCRQRLLERRRRQLEATLAAQRAQFVALHPEWATDTAPPPKPKTTKPAPDHPWRRAQFGSAKFKQYPNK
jgi:hypothetical protein